MSCRKAFETDLAEFTLEPSGPGFAEFRQHVAGCPACTAEVSVWSELGRQLATGMRHPVQDHPSVEVLLGFGDGEALSREERRLVEGHLSQCPTCRDELRSLERFDFANLRQSSPEVPVSRLREGPRLAAWLRQLLVHPAFAYGLVVLLIMPTVLTRFGLLPGVSPSIEYERQAQDSIQADSAVRSLMEETEGRANFPARLGVDAGRPTSSSVQRLEADLLVGEAHWLSKGGELPDRSLGEAMRRHGIVEQSDSAHGARRAREASRERDTASLRQPSGLLSQDGEGIEFSPGDAGRPATLRIRLPRGVRAGVLYEVRIASVDASRELRQKLEPSQSAVEIKVVLPADWLAKGLYGVELHAVPLVEGTEPLGVYHINVP